MLRIEPLLPLPVLRSGSVRQPGRPFAPGGNHADAVDRTRRYAKIAAGAEIGRDRVHKFASPYNRIDRACLYAQRAAYAISFVDDRNHRGRVRTAIGI